MAAVAAAEAEQVSQAAVVVANSQWIASRHPGTRVATAQVAVDEAARDVYQPLLLRHLARRQLPLTQIAVATAAVLVARLSRAHSALTIVLYCRVSPTYLLLRFITITRIIIISNSTSNRASTITPVSVQSSARQNHITVRLQCLRKLPSNAVLVTIRPREKTVRWLAFAYSRVLSLYTECYYCYSCLRLFPYLYINLLFIYLFTSACIPFLVSSCHSSSQSEI